MENIGNSTCLIKGIRTRDDMPDFSQTMMQPFKSHFKKMCHGIVEP